MYVRIGRKTRSLQARLDHTQTAIRKNCPFEGLVCLQSDDDFILAIDITGLVGQHGRWRCGIDGEDAVSPLFSKKWLKLFPDFSRSLGSVFEKILLAFIRRNVADYEIANIDAVAPIAGLEIAPAIFARKILGY